MPGIAVSVSLVSTRVASGAIGTAVSVECAPGRLLMVEDLLEVFLLLLPRVVR